MELYCDYRRWAGDAQGLIERMAGGVVGAEFNCSTKPRACDPWVCDGEN